MIFADLHTHTIASRTGLSTLKENIEIAAGRGLEYIAITDHDCFSLNNYPPNIEVARIACPRRLRAISGIKVICGVEATIGTDIDPKYADRLNKSVPWRIAAFHNHTFTKDLATELAMQIGDCKRIHPDALAHIESALPNDMDDDIVESEIRALIDVAIDNGVFLEINTGSLRSNYVRLERMKKWIPYAAGRGGLFYLGTDAHYCTDVGNVESAYALLKTLGLEDVYILNEDLQSLEQLYNGGVE